jgi:hypothetical protein
MINEMLHAIKERQAEIRLALANGRASDYPSYQHWVGEYQGLQWVLDTIDKKLAETDL